MVDLTKNFFLSYTEGFGERLETIEAGALLAACRSLRRIAIPLKENMFPLNSPGFYDNLTTVHLIGRAMNEDINRINQVLPDTSQAQGRNTATLEEWFESIDEDSLSNEMPIILMMKRRRRSNSGLNPSLPKSSTTKPSITSYSRRPQHSLNSLSGVPTLMGPKAFLNTMVSLRGDEEREHVKSGASHLVQVL